MAFDEKLAGRIRDLIDVGGRVEEKTIFGGLAFLVEGNMVIAASGEGGILVRVDRDQGDELVSRTAAELAVMRGRPMRGWLRVAPDALGTKRQLEPWVRMATDYASSLPAKKRRAGRSSD